MNIMKNCHWGTLSLLLVVLFSSLTTLSGASTEDSEIITTIILINRQAELVDVNTEGEVLKRHLAVPDYFSSGRSHNRSLRKSLSLLKSYGQHETIDASPNYMLPNSSKLPGKCLQSFMRGMSEAITANKELHQHRHLAPTTINDADRGPQKLQGEYQKSSAAFRGLRACSIKREIHESRPFSIFIPGFDNTGKQRINYDRRLPRSGIYIT